LIIHKPSLGSREVPHKIWARSVQPFWRLLDTNKQTRKVYIYKLVILVKLFALRQQLKYWNNVAFLFYCLLNITVFQSNLYNLMLETFDILNHEFYSKFKITIRFQRLRDDFGALRFRSLTLNEPTIWGQIIPGFCFYLLTQKKFPTTPLKF